MVRGIDGMQELVGETIGPTEWRDVTQADIDTFADLSGDDQWIHVDVERAKAESPFGGPVAHGYLTLSLLPMLVPQIIEITGFRMGVNYGLEKVRFPSPVPVGSRIRAGATLESALPARQRPDRRLSPRLLHLRGQREYPRFSCPVSEDKRAADPWLDELRHYGHTFASDLHGLG